MKIIFLDIDGVLNSHQYLSRSDLEDLGIYSDIDDSKVVLLKEIVNRTGASIVLSSSWRTMLTDTLEPIEQATQNLLTILSSHGLSLYDKTECLGEKRPEEIRLWLLEHPAVKSFVILDDDWNFDWGDLKSHWVKTSYYIGLTKEDVIQAVKILGDCPENCVNL